MKNKFIASGAVIIALALLAVGTVAYLVSEARTTNIITTGSVVIKLDEYSKYYPPKESPEPGGGYPQNVLYTDPEEPVVPGETIDKIPVVTNIGTADCWLRISLTLDVDPLTGREVITVEDPYEDVSINFVDGFEANWQEEGGWYYLKTPLAPGEETPLLFDTVSLNLEMGNEFEDRKITLDVLAEAVQSKNNPYSGSYADLWNES